MYSVSILDGSFGFHRDIRLDLNFEGLLMYEGMRIVAMIPARIESARLPRKLLLDESGQSLIQHTVEAVQRVKFFDRIFVATDSEEIRDVVESVGASAIMTGTHSSGTDRIVEAISKIDGDYDVIVNIQGDEPEITAEPIMAMLVQLSKWPSAAIATAATRFDSQEELLDPACVKVVLNQNETAAYFSRSVIPSIEYHDLFNADLSDGPWRRHIGIYAYRLDFLQRWHSLPESRLQKIESLEQLRPLEAGERIQVATVSGHPPGIDTRADYNAFLERIGNR